MMEVAIANLLCAWIVGGLTIPLSFLLVSKKAPYTLYMTLTKEQRETEAVQFVIRQYKKAVWRFLILMFVTSAFFFAFPGVSSYQVFYLTIWCTFVLVGQYKIIHKYTGELYRMKEENGWLLIHPKEVVRLDTVVTGKKKILPASPMFFLFSIWLLIGQTIWYFLQAREYPGMLVFLVMNYISLGMFFYLYHKAAHTKSRVYCDDSDINLTINKVAKRSYTGCVLIEAFTVSFYCFLMMLTMRSYMKNVAEMGNSGSGVLPGIILWSVFFSVLSVIEFVFAAKKITKVKKALLTGKKETFPEDEDAAWKNGYYYNPKDSNSFVEDRTKLLGTGITVNMATPAGKATGYLLLGVLILCLFLAVGLFPLDFGKVTVTTTEKGVLTKACLYYKEFVSFDEIEKATLLSECPELTRVFGSGMEHVALGDYHFKGYGSGKAMVTREAEQFLMIEKTNGDLICISVSDNDEMEEIYRQIISRKGF